MQEQKILAQIAHGTLLRNFALIEHITWSPNSKYLATASRDGTCKIYSIDEEKIISIQDFKTWEDLQWVGGPDVEYVCFSPDSSYLLMHVDNRDRFYDILNDKEIITVGSTKRLPPCNGGLSAVISPNGHYIAIARGGKKICAIFSAPKEHILKLLEKNISNTN